jgi:RNA polymerase sigma-70 factor (ECF subfamily)
MAPALRDTPDAEPPQRPGPLPFETDGDATDDAAEGEPLVPDGSEAGTPPRSLLQPAPSDAQLAQLISAVALHDERALAALYDATLSRVYGLVLRVVRNPALAEEVVEDTYFQVWRQALRFDGNRGRALPWLLGMARSRAIDTLRREARFRHESLDDGAQPDGPATDGCDELLAAARSHAALHQALMALHAQPRQLVALAFFRGLSHEEIAAQTALPLGTVKSQIRRAVISLRECLGDGAVALPAFRPSLP